MCKVRNGNLRKQNFEGKLTSKLINMSVFKEFSWDTYNPRRQPMEKIVQHMWRGLGIPHREFADCCVFDVRKLALMNPKGKYIEKYYWSVMFGRRIDPIMQQYVYDAHRLSNNDDIVIH